MVPADLSDLISKAVGVLGQVLVTDEDVVDGDWAHASGATGFDHTTMTIPDDVVEQAERCLRDIGTALAEAERAFADVVRVRYLLPGRSVRAESG